jgi:hypothetical protein
MQLYPGKKNTIYLYGDTGAGQVSLFHTSKTFKKLFLFLKKIQMILLGLIINIRMVN